MEELKACPFCGRKPEIRHNADGFSYVLCANDGCYARTDGCLNDNEAAKAWNRRAEPENKPLTLEELRKMQGQPVYCIGQTRFDVHFDGWKVVTKNNSMVNVIRFTDGTDFPVDVYGKRLLAYARKPEGSETDGSTD